MSARFNTFALPEVVAAEVVPGALQKLQTVTFSAATTADIGEGFMDVGNFDQYIVEMNQIVVTTNSTNINFRLKLGGSFLTSNYNYLLMRGTSDNTVVSGRNGTTAVDIECCFNVSNASNSSASGQFLIYNAAGSVRRNVNFTTGWNTAGGINQSTGSGTGSNSNTTIIQGIRFLADAGTISGTLRLYGVTK